MLMNTYSPQSSRLLAASVVAGAGSRLRSGSPADARIVEVGGGWHPSTWREGLRKLTSRGTVTAVALRTLPHERQLSDQDWAQISRGLADQAGLADRPWAAVRTSATTVALLTASSPGPLRVDAARAFVRTVSTWSPLNRSAQPASSQFVDSSAAATNGEGSAVQSAEALQSRGIARSTLAVPPAAAPDTATTALPHSVAAPVHQPGTRPHTR